MPLMNERQIEKKYVKEVYGTEAPNVVVSIKGGSKASDLGPASSSGGKSKQSSLRKKVNNIHDTRWVEKKSILPYIKGFFT